MKSIIKFLNNPLIYIIVISGVIFTLCYSAKFFIIYFLMAPIATALIWMLNWNYYKKIIVGFKSTTEVTIGMFAYILIYIFDMMTWPIALIQTSKIILDEEVNV